MSHKINENEGYRPIEELSKMFNKFTNLVDRDIKGVHIGCYSVALIGLTIAIRKVRPFSKFKAPKNIPDHFIKEKRELTGLVKRIEPNGGGLLMIEHKPLVDIPLIPSGQLPVKISGVNISGLGLNWLQAVVAGREIKFVPVAKNKDFVQCQVLLVQKSKNKNQYEFLNIGERLVKIGFGQTEVIRPLAEDPALLSYYKRLQAAENYALRKKLGIKFYIKPTKNALVVIYTNFIGLSKKSFQFVKKQIKTIPHMSPA